MSSLKCFSMKCPSALFKFNLMGVGAPLITEIKDKFSSDPYLKKYYYLRFTDICSNDLGSNDKRSKTRQRAKSETNGQN